MAPPETSPDAALEFEGRTSALEALQRTIDRLRREQRRLSGSFDSIVAAVDAALDRGELPLSLIDELEQLDRQIQRLEADLTGQVAAATKLFASTPGPI